MCLELLESNPHSRSHRDLQEADKTPAGWTEKRVRVNALRISSDRPNRKLNRVGLLVQMANATSLIRTAGTSRSDTDDHSFVMAAISVEWTASLSTL